MSKSEGALLGDVSSDGPAGKSGLQRGDVILEMNGQPITETKDFRLNISMTPPGTTVHLKVFRKGETRDYDVTLGELPSKEEKTDEEGGSSSGVLQGLSVETLTPQIANSIGLPVGTKGVVVDSVDPGSAAAEAGLQRGDVIQEVNRQPVMNLSDFSSIARRIGTESVLLLVNRGGNTLYAVIAAH